MPRPRGRCPLARAVRPVDHEDAVREFFTDEQQDLLQLVARAGGRLTIRGQEPIELRRVLAVAMALQAQGVVRVMSPDTAAYVELTDEGRASTEWAK